MALGNATTAINQTITGLSTFGLVAADAIVGGGSANGSVITFNNNNATFNSAGASLGSGTTNFAGTIGGTGTNQNNIQLVVATGSGVLELSGNNTFTGGTTLQQSYLLVNNPGALGTSGNITFTGGFLQYTANNTVDYSSRIKNSNASVGIDIALSGQTVTYASPLDASE